MKLPAETADACWYRWVGQTLILEVHVQTRAARDEIAGVHDGRLKIRITAPPVEGAANIALIAFLARCCRVSRSRITLTRGARGRNKQFRIKDPSQLPDFRTP